MSGLVLRPWRRADVDHVVRYAESSPGLWHQLPDPDRFAELYLWPNEGPEGKNGFAVCLGDLPIGNASVRMDRWNNGWCSYWVAGEFRGHGYATSALATIADHAFRELEVYRLELAHRVDNEPSRRVAERAGFVFEGIMRGEVEYDGVRYDTRLWSRLVTDPAPDVPLATITR